MTCLLLAALLPLIPGDFFADLEKRYPPTSEQLYVAHLATVDGFDAELIVRQGAVGVVKLPTPHGVIGIRILGHDADGGFELWVMKFGMESRHSTDFDTIEQLEKLHIMGFEQREVLTGNLFVDIKLLQH